MNAANTAKRLRPAMAFLAIMIAFVPPVCSSTDSLGDWPQFDIDPQHEGASVSLAPHSNQTAWISENISAQEGSCVAVADGRVFVGQTENMNYNALHALNAITGEMVWSYPAGGSSPAVAGGMVFTIGSGKVYAFGRGGVGQ